MSCCKIREYECTIQDCDKYGQIVELFIPDEYMNSTLCESCQNGLKLLMSAPKGYVKGSSTPVKQ